MSLELERPEWQADAACAGFPDWERVFFPGQGEDTARAMRICGRCPVRDDCLAYALQHHPIDGIWGGTSERQRRRLRRQLGYTTPPAPDLSTEQSA